MKKRWFCFLLLFVICLSGCTFLKGNSQSAVATYPDKEAPAKIFKTDAHWVALVNSYGSSDYTLSVSEDLHTLQGVYTATDVSIWFMAVNDTAAFFCEETEEHYTYKAYLLQEKTMKTVFSTPAGDIYQTQEVGLLGNLAYYCYIDYASLTVSVIAYDLLTGTTSVAWEKPYVEAEMPYCFAVEGNLLSVAHSKAVTVLDLTTGDIPFSISLPNEVQHVFSVSYDPANDACALYYSDQDSEDIGIIAEGATKITSHFTFGSNRYAYHDQIKCINGYIYWIAQANITGNVTDHYQLVIYNYKTGKPTEIKRTFYFHYDDGTLYSLRFDKNGDYSNIELMEREVE
ncbi:MAG: hypothetical protein E7644_03655 [Ruminococcaceae bacterium]|nr:hypothetical protein [Oscillospiraceae bacterium]